MASQSCSPRANLTAWKWTAFLLSSLWVSIGCTPASISYFLMPQSVPPVCKLAKKKEVTVCIVTNFASLETRPEAIPAEGELTEMFSQHLRKRSLENKEKIKIVSPSKVRSYQNQADFASRSLHEIGKHFEADYVIALEINNLSLYEKGSTQMLYRGNTEIHVQVIDVTKAKDEGTIYTDAYRREYPSRGPVDASETSAPQFRARFLNTVASELTRLFVAYPLEDRHGMD